MNVSFVDEDPTVIQAHTETENVPSSVVDEKLDAKLSTTNGEISATATDKDVDSDKKSYSGIANGVAGDAKTHSSVAGSHQDPTVSNTATKRKSFGVSSRLFRLPHDPLWTSSCDLIQMCLVPM